MFIRLKKRKRKPKWGESEPRNTFEAILVENYRTDGKVRQRCIKKLALIRQENVQYPGSKRFFWEKISKKLESLGLAKEQRESISARFREKVPEPPPDETDHAFHVMEASKNICHGGDCS